MPVTLNMTLPDEAMMPFQALLIANYQGIGAQLEMMEKADKSISDPVERANFDEYGKMLGMQLAIVTKLLQGFPKPEQPGAEKSLIVGLDGRPANEDKKLVVPG